MHSSNQLQYIQIAQIDALVPRLWTASICSQFFDDDIILTHPYEIYFGRFSPEPSYFPSQSTAWASHGLETSPRSVDPSASHILQNKHEWTHQPTQLLYPVVIMSHPPSLQHPPENDGECKTTQYPFYPGHLLFFHITTFLFGCLHHHFCWLNHDFVVD